MSHANPLPALPDIRTGLYRHYKGALYEVLGVVRHSETLEPMVLYRPVEGDGSSWVRPLAMFLGEVEITGQAQPRFAWMGTLINHG